MIINASKIEKITTLASQYGIICEERLDLGGVTHPVILSDSTDPLGEVANTLASSGVPVLYLAYEPPINLSSYVRVMSGESISWDAIYAWITQAEESMKQQVQIANLNVKRTIGVFGIQPGIGASSIARGLSLFSAQHGKKTLYIDLNYRFPKAPYLIGYKGNTLEELLESLLNKTKPNMEPFFLHKSKMQNLTKHQQEHFKTLPDDFYVLSPSGELGLEYFPNVGVDLDEVTDLMKKVIDGAKPYFETIIISMSSDPDEILNLAALRVCDQRLFVSDTSPSSVSLFPQRIKLLTDSGVPMEGAQTVLNKVPAKMNSIQPIEELLAQTVTYSVGYDATMVEEINNLNLLGGTVFKKGIESMSEQLLGIRKAGKESSGLLGFLRSSSKSTKASSF
ncbi:hypothetical protein QO009_003062 [Brevibacillus aydinogluensis]|jgi:hypothetical protein|uniref:hypothetical protein n=1 Tax=Brevibacillus aydinogluensis TaxID=927786 RepID=UPI0028937063|nr:hypothetical protein [Brevibacillus aydinogluensis]MDT3417167.1 hypothetical protein [Brevibacillus aydinogluensis]